MGAQRSPNPQAGFEGAALQQRAREGREGDGVREGEEREGRGNERRDGSEGKRWALANFGGKGTIGPLRCQTLSCSYVYPNSAERNHVVIHLH